MNIHIVDTEVVEQTMRRLDLEASVAPESNIAMIMKDPVYRVILKHGVKEGVREALGALVQAYGLMPEEEK